MLRQTSGGVSAALLRPGRTRGTGRSGPGGSRALSHLCGPISHPFECGVSKENPNSPSAFRIPYSLCTGHSRTGRRDCFVRCMSRPAQPFSAAPEKSLLQRKRAVASHRSGVILSAVNRGGVPAVLRANLPCRAACQLAPLCQPANPTQGRSIGVRLGARTVACDPCVAVHPRKRGTPPMRITYLLLPLTLAFLAVTSGCHHKHCCCGGCMAAPCCSPCACGYTPPIEGAVPPLAAPQAPLVAPIVHSR